MAWRAGVWSFRLKVMHFNVETRFEHSAKRKKKSKIFDIHGKQGRIHGYPSRVRVRRGTDWVGAVMRKLPLIAEKAKC